MKILKNKWTYVVFSVIIIVGLALALVLIPKGENKELKTPPEETEVFATSFNLNLPDNISLFVGGEIELNDGYFSVKPVEMKNKISYEIIQIGAVENLTFENNKIKATAVGSYSIKFKMPKSKNTNFSKTIRIDVYEEKEMSHLTQTISTLIIGEEKFFDEIFNFKTNLSYEISSDDKLIVSNNKVLAQQVGEGNLNVSIIDNFIKYNYLFKLTIKDEPQYKIVIINPSNNSLVINLQDDDIAYVNYLIKNREEQNVKQEIKIEILDESIIQFEKITDDALIKFKALTNGDTTIKISLKNDESIFVSISVHVC